MSRRAINLSNELCKAFTRNQSIAYNADNPLGLLQKPIPSHCLCTQTTPVEFLFSFPIFSFYCIQRLHKLRLRSPVSEIFSCANVWTIEIWGKKTPRDRCSEYTRKMYIYNAQVKPISQLIYIFKGFVQLTRTICGYRYLYIHIYAIEYNGVFTLYIYIFVLSRGARYADMISYAACSSTKIEMC